MRALIDACVLYPTVLREIVAGAAAAGLFTPLWSPRILAEWQHAAARLGPAQAAIAEGEAVALAARFPDACLKESAVARAADAYDCTLPDAGDAHVLAAALAGRADLILTLNLRDFPRAALARHGLRAEHPDAFLLALWRTSPEIVADIVETVRARAERIAGTPQPLRPLLKRARLPRLGKALSPG